MIGRLYACEPPADGGLWLNRHAPSPAHDCELRRDDYKVNGR
jgi:hypothetical protein